MVHVSFKRLYLKLINELARDLEQKSENIVFQIDANGDQVFKVSNILSHRKRGTGFQWLTLLKGTSNHDADWQPTRDFMDSNGSMTVAFLDYIKEHGPLPHLYNNFLYTAFSHSQFT